MTRHRRPSRGLRGLAGLAAALCAIGALTACGASSGSAASGGPSGPGAGASSGSSSAALPTPLSGRSAKVALRVVSAHNATIVLLPVSINGKGPFVFALDTGSSTSLIDSSVAQSLGLTPHGQGAVNGVACTTKVRHVKITHWSTGDLRLPPDTLVVTSLAAGGGHLDGLLGSDVLSEYGTVTIDYRHGQLAVGDAAKAYGTNTERIPLKIVHATNGATLALAPVTIGGRGPFTFALDTGAATSTLGLDVARELGLPLHSTHTTVTGVACSTNVHRTRLSDWAVGKRALPAGRVDVLKFPNAHGEGLQGLLGSNVLATFGTITVDYATGTLRIAANHTAPSGHTPTLNVTPSP